MKNGNFKYYNIIVELIQYINKNNNINILKECKCDITNKKVGYEIFIKSLNENFYIGFKNNKFKISSINKSIYYKCLQNNLNILIMFQKNEKNVIYDIPQIYQFNIDSLKNSVYENFRKSSIYNIPMINFYTSYGINITKEFFGEKRKDIEIDEEVLY